MHQVELIEEAEEENREEFKGRKKIKLEESGCY